MRRLIVCKACKIFDVPYSKISKARILLSELLLQTVIVKTFLGKGEASPQ